MPASRRIKIGEAWRSLAPGQGFLVLCLGLAAIASGFLLGALLRGGQDQRSLGRKEDRVATLVGGLRNNNGELARQFSDLAIAQTELLQRNAALEKSLAASRADRKALAGEAEFLNRYIAYMRPTAAALARLPDAIPADAKPADAKPGDAKPGDAKPQEAGHGDPRPLADTLCALWKSGDRQFVRFETGPLELAAQDFDQGRVSADLQTLLVENFVSIDSIQQIRVAESAQAGGSKPGKPAVAHPTPGPNATSVPLIASVGRQAQAIKILKAIAFLDGGRYEIPRSIAVAVQIRRECVPY
jgi:hypothetical protein